MKNLASKTAIFGCLFILCIGALSCKKPDTPTSSSTTYASLADFYAKNGVQSQFFNIDAVAGGSFTTPQGTKVTISPNSFVDLNNNPVSGTVRVEFKDIYKKSDMLMSSMPPMLGTGAPLVSGGEFFTRAVQINTPDTTFLNLANKKSITVQQPINGKRDTAMAPFIMGSDSIGVFVWHPTHLDTLNALSSSYIFSMYSYSAPVRSGTWCNSDNSTYFAAYKQTALNINPGFNVTDFDDYVDVYLIFKGLNAMVHVYQDVNYPYYYAPVGLSCTIVAVGIKNNNLWASFTPISISANQSVTIPISQITTADFKSKLTALDN